MKKLFLPSIVLMNRLRYPYKLALIGLLFLLPLSMVMYYFEREINSGIEFARLERTGVVYENALTGLLQSLLRDQHAVCGGTNGPSKLTEAAHAHPEVEAAMAAVDALDKQYGAQLKSTQGWSDLKTKWGALQAKTAQTDPTQALNTYHDFANDLFALMTTVGNNSNLILDPQVDTYYVMDTILTQMPQTVINLSMAADMGALAITHGGPDADGKTQLTVLTGQITTPAGTVLTDLDPAIKANPKIKAQVDPTVKPFMDTVNQCVDLISHRLLATKGTHLPAAELVASGTAALDAGFTYYQVGSSTLDQLLDQRLSGFLARRSMVNLCTVVFVLLAAYCFIGFYFSAIGGVTLLLDTAKRIGAGNFEGQIEMPMRDEVGQMARRDLAEMAEMAAGLRALAQAAQEIADGNLRVEVAVRNEDDRLGLAFRHMIAKLRLLIGAFSTNIKKVQEASVELAEHSHLSKTEAASIAQAIDRVSHSAENSAQASHEMAMASELQAQAATLAADAMNQLQAAVEQVNQITGQQALAAQHVGQEIDHTVQTIRDVAASAQQMMVTAQQAESTAQSGAHAVEKTISSMDRIGQLVSNSAQRVAGLGAKGQEIGGIVDVINQIAEQTNLLALNAAIEAARAGEQGRGFAVVADEVRKLAEKSTQATREIGLLIGTVRQEVAESVLAMEASSREVQAGVTLSREAGAALTQMRASVQSVSTQVEGVLQKTTSMSASADEVLSSAEIVLRGTRDNASAMDSMTDQMEKTLAAITTVASTSEQTAAGAQEMSASAQDVARNAYQVAASVTTLNNVIAVVSSSAQLMQQEAAKVAELLVPFERWDRRLNETPEQARQFANRRTTPILDAARHAWLQDDEKQGPAERKESRSARDRKAA